MVVNSTITYNQVGLVVIPGEMIPGEASGATAEVWFSTITDNGIADDFSEGDFFSSGGGVLAAEGTSLNLYSTLLSDNSLNCANAEEGFFLLPFVAGRAFGRSEQFQFGRWLMP